MRFLLALLALIVVGATPIPCQLQKAPGHVILSWRVLPRHHYWVLGGTNMHHITNVLHQVSACQIGTMTASFPMTNRLYYYRVLEGPGTCP